MCDIEPEEFAELERWRQDALARATAPVRRAARRRPSWSVETAPVPGVLAESA